MTDDDQARQARATPRSTPFLNTPQAAAWLGMSPRRLEAMRKTGAGPHFRRHGRSVRYHVDDLAAWSTAHSTRKIGE